MTAKSQRLSHFSSAYRLYLHAIQDDTADQKLSRFEHGRNWERFTESPNIAQSLNASHHGSEAFPTRQVGGVLHR